MDTAFASGKRSARVAANRSSICIEFPFFDLRSLFSFSTSAADPPTYPDKTNLLLLKDSTGKETPINTAKDWATKRGYTSSRTCKSSAARCPADSKGPARSQEEEERSGHLPPFQDVHRRGEGRSAPFYLLLPRNAKAIKPAVVRLHPTSRDLGKGVAVGMGPKADRAYAVHLAERGTSRSHRLRNMGEYKFDPYANNYTAAMKGIWNHMRCVDYLLSRKDVDRRTH